MALSTEAAARKDRTTRGEMQHRHFATIATIIRERFEGTARNNVAQIFCEELGQANVKFDRRRFLAACDVN